MYFGRTSQVSMRRVVLFASDAATIALSVFLSAVLRLGWGVGIEYLLQNVIPLTGVSLIFLLIFYAGGMYEREVITQKLGASFFLPVVVTAIGLVVTILAFYAHFELHIGRGVLLLASLFVAVGTWLVRRILRIALGYGLFTKKTLIVGSGREADEVLALLESASTSGYSLYGVVSVGSGQSGGFLRGVPVLGDIASLREYVAAYDVETLIVATAPDRTHLLFHILRPLRYAGIQIMDYVALYEELGTEIPLDHIDDEWLMHAAMNSSRIHIRQIKRVMDLGVSLIGLIVLSPLVVLAAMAIKLTSPGPILYRQERVGREGKVYTLLKLRTMRQDAEAESGAVWASARDRRITPVGCFLRTWRIDEIPQLVNVLRGEMSLVGPRPERPEFVATLKHTIPFYQERLLVAPGITGWAQVKFPYATSIEATKRKLQFDLYYIKHMSLYLDVLILLRTFRTIIVGLRYTEGPENGAAPQTSAASAGASSRETANA